MRSFCNSPFAILPKGIRAPLSAKKRAAVRFPPSARSPFERAAFPKDFRRPAGRSRKRALFLHRESAPVYPDSAHLPPVPPGPAVYPRKEGGLQGGGISGHPEEKGRPKKEALPPPAGRDKAGGGRQEAGIAFLPADSKAAARRRKASGRCPPEGRGHIVKADNMVTGRDGDAQKAAVDL